MTESAETATGPRPPGEPSGDGEVTVVGTAHVSAESADRVRETIEEERPDVVAVELDEGRYRQMQGETPDDLEPRDLLGGNTVFQFLAYWMLSYVQSRMGDRFDIEPGADMMAAIEAAEAQGIGVALADRDIQVTIQRFWKRLTFLERVKLIGNLTLAIGEPPFVGLSLGASLGVLVGTVAGTVGAGTLGIAGSDVVAAVGAGPVQLAGGLVAGALAGLVLWSFADDAIRSGLDALSLPTQVEVRVLAGVALGTVAGGALAAVGGAAVGPLGLSAGQFQSVGGFALQVGAALAVAVPTGAVLGYLLGLLVASVVVIEDEEFDEFDPEAMTDTDVVSAMMEEFRRFSPGGAEALIDERDAYIAHNLVALREQGYRVVAVVGAGHREGIEAYLDAPETLPTMASISGTASGRRFSVYKLFGYVFSLGFVVAFGLLVLGGAGDAFLLKVFAAWFVFNGVFAFGLAKLAGARWQSAGVGGLVAWLTSLNPLLAPGWFAGYVELRYTTVNVGDIGKLNEILGDEESPLEDVVSRLFDVPLFKLIMIVALTNVGSMIASFLFPVVVLPYLVSGPEDRGVGWVADTMWRGIENGVDVLAGLAGHADVVGVLL